MSTSKEVPKKPHHRVRPIGRLIFGIIVSIFILIGLVNIIITEGFIDGNKMLELMGEISAAFNEDPIGNIFQLIRFFTLMIIFLPAKIHPLAGYLIFLPLAIASFISCILKLFKSLLGMPIWKEQLCSAIDVAKEHSRNLVELKEYLKENFDIEMKVQNKNLSYLHPDKQKYCQGYKLGHAYTKEEINSEFERKGKT